MANYEMLADVRGRDARMVEIGGRTAFFQAQEPGLVPENTHGDGVITVSGVKNGMWFRYEFTDD